MDNFGHPMIAFRVRNAVRLAGLGDDSSSLIAHYGVMQATQITNLHNSGALSDQGYSYLVLGAVDPSDVAEFLANDPGASASSSGSTVNTAIQTAISAANAAVPRPSPSVASTIPPSGNLTTWFTQSTLITGIPNWMVFGGLLVGVLVIGGTRRR